MGHMDQIGKFQQLVRFASSSGALARPGPTSRCCGSIDDRGPDAGHHGVRPEARTQYMMILGSDCFDFSKFRCIQI
jgi:hypothetical protein